MLFLGPLPHRVLRLLQAAALAASRLGDTRCIIFHNTLVHKTSHCARLRCTQRCNQEATSVFVMYLHNGHTAYKVRYVEEPDSRHYSRTSLSKYTTLQLLHPKLPRSFSVFRHFVSRTGKLKRSTRYCLLYTILTNTTYAPPTCPRKP